MAPSARAALRLALTWFLAVVAALAAVEGLAGWQREGGHARLPIYAAAPPLSLRPGAAAVGLASGGTYRLAIDARGLRAPSPERGIVLLGDSMAFGLGVAGEATLAAQCTERGHPMLNAGVPGFSLPDALAHAESFSAIADGWMMLVNPWDDGQPALTAHAEPVGGWLLNRDAPAWAKRFFASRWSHGQLLHEAVVLAGGLRPRAPVGSDFAARGREMAEFVRLHPKTRVVWAGYPGETMPDGRRADDERRAFGVETETLELHDAWLPGDLHWTAEGTAQAAEQLCR